MNGSKKKGSKILLTSALPYANGSIHIGHLVEYIQTDIFSRFLKLTGENVIYCCADDAHGTAIEIKASKEGISPEQLIGKVREEHQTDFAKYHIHFDNYHTTHSEENRQLSTEIYNKLKAKGLIYTKEIESLYDEQAKRFLPDRYIKGKCPKCHAPDQYGDVCEKCNSTHKPIDLIDPYSTVSGSKPVIRKSKHYFFKLSAMTEQLRDYFDKRNFQPEIVNYLTNWLDDGLADWDISRDGPYFGFKIPDENDKYFYVWLDAPIGYLASCKNYCDKHGQDANEYFTGKDSKMIHIIGKDIMYFHFLFWPAMLMATGYNLPTDIIVHGFLTVGKEKMSKSRGTFLTANEFAKMYEPEYLRYYYAKVLSKKMADIDLDFNLFVEVVNSELVANISNLCYRIMSFTEKNYGGELVKFDPKDYPVLSEITGKIESVKKYYADLNYNRAVAEIMEISSLGNKFFQDNAPWQLKKEGKEDEAKKACAVGCNIVKVLSIIMSPILPKFSENLQKQLNLKKNLTWDDAKFDLMNHKLGKAEIIIRKIEVFKEKEETFVLNLKVAKVLESKVHANSEKLLVMKIDVGEDKPRQLVAGLQKFYKPEQMIGKNIVLVSNMKPAKLGGELSEGMLLAASPEDDSTHTVLEAPNAKPGDLITCGDMKNSAEEIKYDQFAKLKIAVKDKKALVTDFGKNLTVNGNAVSIDVGNGWQIG